MKYEVYTDGACQLETKRCSSAFLVLTQRTFVMKDYITFHGGSINESETVALGYAAHRLIPIVQKGDEVIFHTDSISAMEFVKKFLEDGIIRTRNDLVKDALISVMVLQSNCKVSIVKVRGHKAKCNINNYVDLYCKHGLYYGE